MFYLLANNTFRGSQQAINTQVDAMKIGRQIAEQALECHRRTLDSSPGKYIFIQLNHWIPFNFLIQKLWIFFTDGSPDPEDDLLSTLNTLPPPISLFADIPPNIDPVHSFSPVRPLINGIAQPRINGVTGTQHSNDPSYFFNHLEQYFHWTFVSWFFPSYCRNQTLTEN